MPSGGERWRREAQALRAALSRQETP
jgi:hypothetical protein